MGEVGAASSKIRLGVAAAYPLCLALIAAPVLFAELIAVDHLALYSPWFPWILAIVVGVPAGAAVAGGLRRSWPGLRLVGTAFGWFVPLALATVALTAYASSQPSTGPDGVMRLTLDEALWDFAHFATYGVILPAAVCLGFWSAESRRA